MSYSTVLLSSYEGQSEIVPTMVAFANVELDFWSPIAVILAVCWIKIQGLTAQQVASYLVTQGQLFLNL